MVSEASKSLLGWGACRKVKIFQQRILPCKFILAFLLIVRIKSFGLFQIICLNEEATVWY